MFFSHLPFNSQFKYLTDYDYDFYGSMYNRIANEKIKFTLLIISGLGYKT